MFSSKLVLNIRRLIFTFVDIKTRGLLCQVSRHSLELATDALSFPKNFHVGFDECQFCRWMTEMDPALQLPQAASIDAFMDHGYIVGRLICESAQRLTALKLGINIPGDGSLAEWKVTTFFGTLLAGLQQLPRLERFHCDDFRFTPE